MTQLNSFLSDKPFFLKTAALLFTIGLGILMMSVALMIAGALFFPEVDLLKPEVDLEAQLENIESTMFTQVASQIFLMAIPALIFGYFMRGNGLKYLKGNKFPNLRMVMVSFLVVFLGGIVTQSIIEFNQSLDLPDKLFGIDLSGYEAKFKYWQELSEGMLDGFFQVKSPLEIAAVFFMIAIVPAVSEEFLFRGVIQQLLTEGRTHVFTGILFTSITFALIHFQFYNFFGLVFMAVIFGYLYHYTNNIWLPVIAHFLNNGLQVVLIFLYQFNIIAVDIDQVDHMPIWISGLSFIALTYLLYVLKKRKEGNIEGLG